MSPVIRAAAARPRAPAPAPAVGVTTVTSGLARSGRIRIRGAKKIVQKDVPSFSRQMAAMLSAGMPIVAALETLEEQSANPNFKIVLGEVRRNIENGSAFSEALQQLPDVFDDLYVNMVRSGERSGMFAETMKRIGELLEASARLRRKVKSAMTYPVVVLSLAIIIAIGMIIFVVPVFARMYADFGSKLPGPTQFLVNLSNAGKKGAPFLIPAIAIAVYLFNRWKKTGSGAYAMDQFALKAPVVGVLVQKVAIARFARTLAQLVHSGVPILGALEIVSKACGNRVVGAAVMSARDTVERGDTISNGLAGHAAIPQILIRMMAAGEKTGKLDEMMENIADTFDDEVETMLASLTSMIEPLLMVFLGVVIGGIVLCMFLPIFKMSEVIHM
jgi:type IV pilus assembly protein PilC